MIFKPNKNNKTRYAFNWLVKKKIRTLSSLNYKFDFHYKDIPILLAAINRAKYIKTKETNFFYEFFKIEEGEDINFIANNQRIFDIY